MYIQKDEANDITKGTTCLAGKVGRTAGSHEKQGPIL